MDQNDATAWQSLYHDSRHPPSFAQGIGAAVVAIDVVAPSSTLSWHLSFWMVTTRRQDLPMGVFSNMTMLEKGRNNRYLLAWRRSRTRSLGQRVPESQSNMLRLNTPTMSSHIGCPHSDSWFLEQSIWQYPSDLRLNRVLLHLGHFLPDTWLFSILRICPSSIPLMVHFRI